MLLDLLVLEWDQSKTIFNTTFHGDKDVAYRSSGGNQFGGGAK